LEQGVSKKYEVDEGYWLMEANKKLTDDQRKFQKEQLNNKGNKLENRITLFIVTGLACFGVATTLFMKRKTLITSKESGK